MCASQMYSATFGYITAYAKVLANLCDGLGTERFPG